MTVLRPRAIITGASSGIGLAFAKLLAERGWDLVLVARRAARLEAISAELSANGGEVLPVSVDLADANAAEAIMAAIGDRTIDLLVNNAGYGVAAEFAETDWKTQRDLAMTLVMAVLALTHAVLPGMLARGRGRIITISSILALSQGGRGHTIYPAAKSFVHKFMLSLDAEVRSRGILCTSVLPGSTESEFRSASGMAASGKGFADAFVSSPEAVARAAVDGNARGRLIVIPGVHNRIAAMVMKLAPDSLIRWMGRRTH